MRAWLRRRAAWQVVLGFGAATSLAVLARAVGVPEAVWAPLAIASVLGFIAVLVARADGEGWATWGVVSVVGLALKLVHWPESIELLAFVLVSTALARVLFEPPDPRPA